HALTEIRRIARRIDALFAAGWREVVVVTDHGWLLVPGGMPVASLPLHLTEPRKGRCARLAPGAATDLPTVPWHWDPAVRIALAPGIRCFEAGCVYEHGGLSPQECVIPVIRARAGEGSAAGGVRIERIAWTNLRCNVALAGAAPAMTVDLRRRPADAATSLVFQTKAPEPDGTAALFVRDDDDLVGREATLVVTGPDGTILAQRPTIVGGDDA
ncbi:MAG TPA: hypothetical protein VFX03_01800, partial [Thermomicrobiales bacterium]|nr:hypothetical protein [Thermomicrobiales bacterium]